MKEVYLLKPLTYLAQNWIDNFIEPTATYFDSGVIIEHRYIHSVIKAMIRDGLKVNKDFEVEL